MRKLLLIIASIAVLAGCTGGSAIKVETPSRPAGQEDVVGLATEPIETVRIGIIGIGMRGMGAVYRFNHIPGAEVVALCDVRQECRSAKTCQGWKACCCRVLRSRCMEGTLRA